MSKLLMADFYDQQWRYIKPFLPQLKSVGLKALCCKATMGLGDSDPFILDDFTNTCISQGFMHSFYGWEDPIYGIDQQIDRFSKLINKYDPTWVAMDFEHCWKSWNDFNRWALKQMTWEEIPKLAPDAISEAGKAYFMDLIKIAGKRKTVLYTNAGFVDTYAGPAREWILGTTKTKPIVSSFWDAGYFSNSLRHFASWSEFANALETLPNKKSSLTPLDWDIWQFITVWCPPGMDRVDYSIFKNEAVFETYQHGDVIPTTPYPLPTPAPTVAQYVVTNCCVASVRNTPVYDPTGKNIARFIVVRDPDTGKAKPPVYVSVYDAKNGYSKISNTVEEWISTSLLKPA
jgi:hypothetical protein